jgi:hypothetical protein
MKIETGNLKPNDIIEGDPKMIARFVFLLQQKYADD